MEPAVYMVLLTGEN